MIEDDNCIFCNLSLRNGFCLGKMFELNSDATEIAEYEIPNKMPATVESSDESTIKSIFLKNVGFREGFPNTIDDLIAVNEGKNFVGHWSCLFWATRITIFNESAEMLDKCGNGNYKFSKVEGIRQTLNSSLRTTCIFCGQRGASMHCSHAGCHRIFHYPCFIAMGTNFSCIIHINNTINSVCLCINHKTGGLEGSGLPSICCCACKVEIGRSLSLLCDFCGRHTHLQCVTPPILDDIVAKLPWSCSECRRCAVCGEHVSAVEQNLTCKRCNRYFHNYCTTENSQAIFFCSLCEIVEFKQYDDPLCSKRSLSEGKLRVNEPSEVKSYTRKRHSGDGHSKQVQKSRRKSQMKSESDKDYKMTIDLSKIIIYDKTEHFYTNHDMCCICGSIGREGYMIFCSQCGRTFHYYCADISSETSEWRCLDCTVCFVCNKADNETSLLMCDDCNKTYHTYCLCPPLSCVPSGIWKCAECAHCLQCGRPNAYYEDYTMCTSCYGQKAYICCTEPITEGQLLIRCAECDRWLHAQCDNIRNQVEAEVICSVGYSCPKCRRGLENNLNTPLLNIVDGVGLSKRGIKQFRNERLHFGGKYKSVTKDDIVGDSSKIKQKSRRSSVAEESEESRRHGKKKLNVEDSGQNDDFFACEDVDVANDDFIPRRKQRTNCIEVPNEWIEDLAGDIGGQLENILPSSFFDERTEFLHQGLELPQDETLDNILGLSSSPLPESSQLASGFLSGSYGLEEYAEDERRGTMSIHPAILYSNLNKLELLTTNLEDRFSEIGRIWSLIKSDEKMRYIQRANANREQSVQYQNDNYFPQYMNYYNPHYQYYQPRINPRMSGVHNLPSSELPQSYQPSSFPPQYSRHLDGANDDDNCLRVDEEDMSKFIRQEKTFLTNLSVTLENLRDCEMGIDRLRRTRKSITGKHRQARKCGRELSESDMELLKKSTLEIKQAQESVDVARNRYKQECSQIDEYRRLHKETYGVEWHGEDLYPSMCIDGQSPAQGGTKTFKGKFDRPICPPQRDEYVPSMTGSSAMSSPQMRCEKIENFRGTPAPSVDGILKPFEPKLKQPVLRTSFPFSKPDKIFTCLMGEIGDEVFVDCDKDYYVNLIKYATDQQQNNPRRDLFPLRIPSPPFIRSVSRRKEVYVEGSDKDEEPYEVDNQQVRSTPRTRDRPSGKEGSFEKWMEPKEGQVRITMVMDPNVGNVDITNLVRQFAAFLNIDAPTSIYTQKNPNPETICKLRSRSEYEDVINLSNIVKNSCLVCAYCRNILSDFSFRCNPTWFTHCDDFGLFEEYIHFCSLHCYASLQRSNNMSVNFDDLVEFDHSCLDFVGKGHKAKRKLIDTSVYRGKVLDTGQGFQWKRYSVTPVLKPKTLKISQPNINYANIIRSDEFIDTRMCLFCGQTGDLLSNGGGRLLYYGLNEWVHINCALWSNVVYETTCGALINVTEALKKASRQICCTCGFRGASLICFYCRCFNAYHVECAKMSNCVFCPSKSFFCSQHSLESVETPMDDISVIRQVYVPSYDMTTHISILNKNHNFIMRIGSLVISSFGELLPQHIFSGRFNTTDFIYPSGYEAIRFCICPWDKGKRSKLVFSITEVNERPFFTVEDLTDPRDIIHFEDDDIKCLQTAIYGNYPPPLYDPANDYFLPCLESVFGLTNQNVRVVIESFPGITSLSKYKFRHGKNHVSLVPLLYNSSGCARTEGVDLYDLRRSKKKPKSGGVTGTEDKSSGRTTQSKHSQYRRMMVEKRNDKIRLGRSSIQGLGLFAVRDIEKGTVIVEYIGEIIRNEVANRRERIYEGNNRGVYMFRINDDFVIDASCCGGLARYANHSCSPNCTTEIITFEGSPKILIVSKQRINSGDEITYDYMFNNVLNLIPCMCNSTNCRKWIC